MPGRVDNLVRRRGGSLGAAMLLWAALLLVWLAAASAEQLPVKTYTTADGLLRDEVHQIKQDSRGFLWFCTADGLSRFDGYGFTNYTTDDGLPHRVVNALLETRTGVIWIATDNGLARFNPQGKRGAADPTRNPEAPMFVTYWPEEKTSRSITVLCEDAQGKLWCGTDDGLYWFEERAGSGIFHRLDLPKERPDLPLSVLAITQDQRGSLWVGMENRQGLNRILPDGRIEHYATRRARHESASVTALLETREGEIWAGMIAQLAAACGKQFDHQLISAGGASLRMLWGKELFAPCPFRLLNPITF